MTLRSTLFLVVSAIAASAATFYCDPAGGNAKGDGSAERPWRTVEEVIQAKLIQTFDRQGKLSNPGAPVKPGDTLLLRSGWHGVIRIAAGYNDTPIAIASAPGQTPQVGWVEIGEGRNWRVQGLTVSPSLAPSPLANVPRDLVKLGERDSEESADLIVEDCFIYSVLDTSGWSGKDWVTKPANGIWLGRHGKHHVARNNYVLNTRFGINLCAPECVAEGNVVANFSADGLRVTRDGQVAQYNVIKNVFVGARDGDDNHDDGIQVFLFNVGTGTVRDVTLRGNVIVARENDALPFPNGLQGLGCFDGPLVHFLVESNVVCVNHFHGISLYDAQNCTIQNNTCFSRWSGRAKPWVMLGQKKNQAASNIVRDNFAHSFQFKADQAVKSENNQQVTEAIYKERLKSLLAVINEKFGQLHPVAKRPRLQTTAVPALRVGPKPSDSVPERRARVQPALPDGVQEIPFVETSPAPILSRAEQERGYLLFQRPTTECIYPNTRPLPDERIDALMGFCTPGEFEPVTLALYPIRPLQNLRVRVSALSSSSGEIPADSVDIRLATYWNIGFPSYTTVKTHRRMPELLERVTVHSSPAQECQWYWLTVHAPEDAKPGVYRGTVRVWDDGFSQAIEIPFAFRVLDFRLQKDPAKHFSAYYYTRNRALYKGRDEAFIRRAADKDYQAMKDFGLDMLPTLYLRCDDGKRITLADATEMERMLATGLKGPAPVTADNVIGRIYRDMVPDGKHENHWRISPLPPPAFYDRVTELFRTFEAERKAKRWPEFICCPIDEVDPSCKEFGTKVYAAVKAASLRTYATKDPIGADASDYAPYLDIWCSQPYSMSYERIVSQNRHEYWCYPNHNAGEIKDRRVMCKGGRMTYGFGFWRSGYATLIPWHWCWPSAPDSFDYLRGRYSGCGQRVDDDAEVIPAIYWMCFREGYDDARYLYTLQQAIVEREDSKNLTCLSAVAEGRRLLQETWDSIHVQPKYLAEGMWPSEEFNAIRWRLAVAISKLLDFPVSTVTTAPSVLVATSSHAPSTGKASTPYEAALKAGHLEAFDLGGDFTRWKNGTAEGKTELTEAARHIGKFGLRWTVAVDHEHDGGEGGNYPVGWPRLGRDFKPGEIDMSSYDVLEFWIRVDSNRDEVADDHTPVGLSISGHGKKKALYQKTVDLGGDERVWIPIRFPVKQMISGTEAEAEMWRSISRIQIHTSEHDYKHRTRLTFDIGEVSLLRLTKAAIAGMDAPHHVLLPRNTLAVPFNVMEGASRNSYVVVAAVETAKGKVLTETRQDLREPHRVVLPLRGIEPGSYTLRLTLLDATGKQCSESTEPIMMHGGPLAEP